MSKAFLSGPEPHPGQERRVEERTQSSGLRKEAKPDTSRPNAGSCKAVLCKLAAGVARFCLKRLRDTDFSSPSVNL